MASLNTFITAIQTRIATLADRVYYGDVIPPTEYIPYVVWKYTTTADVEDLQDFFIEVTITDNGPDATRIENTADAINGDGDKTSPTGLHRWHYGSGGSPTFRMFLINRIQLPSMDENMVRRQLRYRVRVYL